MLSQAELKVAWQDPVTTENRFVNCDRRRMLQVLINLVDNARKFTPHGGNVGVSLHADAEEAIFEVSDTGPGIPEADRVRVFRPFSQRNSGVVRGEGVGLGLAIVKAVVDLHGGTVALREGRVGGCVFTICIPQTEAGLVQDQA